MILCYNKVLANTLTDSRNKKIVVTTNNLFKIGLNIPSNRLRSVSNIKAKFILSKMDFKYGNICHKANWSQGSLYIFTHLISMFFLLWSVNCCIKCHCSTLKSLVNLFNALCNLVLSSNKLNEWKESNEFLNQKVNCLLHTLTCQQVSDHSVTLFLFVYISLQSFLSMKQLYTWERFNAIGFWFLLQKNLA